MKLLLDTQVMLWWLLGDQRLRQETRKLMATTACMVSVASVWEVAIKHRLGKLSIDPVTFRDQSLAAGTGLLAINDAHAIETARLPGIHDDPFDLDHSAGAYRRLDGGLVRRTLERIQRRAAASLTV